METSLYPLKFKPIYKEKIWGGNKLKSLFNKNYHPLNNCGESWEISGVKGNISTVSNGKLKDETLDNIINNFKQDLVGSSVYQKFKNEFPLLIKFIDATDDLSIQVHPDDELAKKRENSFGKTEMWYIMQADEGAKLISGFNRKIDKEIYQKSVKQGMLKDILNYEDTNAGDVFFLPAGRVHAITKGIVLAEIQQTSDITYRIYDWDRKDKEGNSRELHTEEAIDAIDYNFYPEYKTKIKSNKNISTPVINCPYFNTKLLYLDKIMNKNYSTIDSFVIYICIDGKGIIETPAGSESISKGEVVLIPASIKRVSLLPTPKLKILESWIP